MRIDRREWITWGQPVVRATSVLTTGCLLIYLVLAVLPAVIGGFHSATIGLYHTVTDSSGRPIDLDWPGGSIGLLLLLLALKIALWCAALVVPAGVLNIVGLLLAWRLFRWRERLLHLAVPTAAGALLVTTGRTVAMLVAYLYS